jgi:hypothetical protein
LGVFAAMIVIAVAALAADHDGGPVAASASKDYRPRKIAA